MRNTKRIVGGLVVVLALGISPAVSADKSDMAGRVTTWEQLYNSAQFDALSEQYTEDATRLPYQAPMIRGRAEISRVNRAFHEAGATKVDLEVLGAESSGRLAWAHGTYHLMDAAGRTFQKGKWMNVSKRVGKEWLIQSDIWNTDAP